MLKSSLAIAAAAAFLTSVAASAQTTTPQDPQSSQPSSPSAAAANGPMTLVGCLVKESDYRKAHKLGKGDLGGMKLGSDYVLVDAHPSTATGAEGASAPTAQVNASQSCSEQGTGEAYRMAGKREGGLKPFVGRYVEITGQFEHARDAKIAAGEKNAKLPAEVIVQTYRAPAAPAAQAPPATTAEAPAPAPNPPAATPPPATTAPAPTATTGTLPKTASNEPLVMLLAVLALSGGFLLRRLRFRLTAR